MKLYFKFKTISNQINIKNWLLVYLTGPQLFTGAKMIRTYHHLILKNILIPYLIQCIRKSQSSSSIKSGLPTLGTVPDVKVVQWGHPEKFLLATFGNCKASHCNGQPDLEPVMSSDKPTETTILDIKVSKIGQTDNCQHTL